MESALVFVNPGESVDTVVAKVRAAGARHVDLLVPTGVPALQSPAGFDRLSRALARDGVGVLVFSADPQVLSAARRGSLEVVRIEGAEVVAPAANGALNTVADDEALLEALDSLPSARPASAPPADPYDNSLSALEDMPSPTERQRLPGETPVLHDWDDLLAEPSASVRAPQTEAPFDESDLAETLPEPGRRPRSGLIGLLTLVALLLALLLGAFWLLGQRASVIIVPPSATPAAEVVDQIVVPLEEGPPAEGARSVQARPLSSLAEVTIDGQASLRTQAPAGSAKGTLEAINNTPSPCNLPAGSDVLVTNAAGQPVVFSVDQDVTISPQTTRTSSDGLTTTTVTTAGTGTASITARAPGSASNIPDGGRATIPACNWLSASAGPLEGGVEQEAVIVGEEDVNALLGRALADLYNQGVSGVQAQLQGSEFSIEQGTISPGPDALVNQRRYEIVSVVPAIGQAVADPNNPTFTLVVRGPFSALATPAGRPLDEQIRVAVQNQLLADGRLPPTGEANITGWAWDGQDLRATAEILIKRDPTGLPVGFAAQLQRDLVGKTSAEAQQLLERYKAEGLIADYRLPASDQMPNWSFLLDVEVASP